MRHLWFVAREPSERERHGPLCHWESAVVDLLSRKRTAPCDPAKIFGEDREARRDRKNDHPEASHRQLVDYLRPRLAEQQQRRHLLPGSRTEHFLLPRVRLCSRES